MPLSPAARTMLDQLEEIGAPPLWQQDIATVREQDRNLLGALDQPVEVASVDNRTMPGPAGEIPVRIYTPGTGGARPLIVYFHGGGFVFCSLDTHDGTCRRLANATGAVVVSVDYRLAPECPFPGPLDDCYAATVWAHEHAADLGADGDQLVVAGDSAGGNLAAATTLLAREHAGPPIVHQILIYPVIDAACETKSFTENGEGYFLDGASMRWLWTQYLGPDGDGTHPHASPIRAADLSGLPPAIVVTAEYDPLRDEGEAYADALQAAGVPATAVRYDGMIHGFVSMPMLFPEADEAMEKIAGALRRAFV
jgi:acetyl esterase